MTVPVSVSNSPLLRLFKLSEPRDLYSLASKANLESGMTVCRHGMIADAAWDDKRTTLDIAFSSQATVSFTCMGQRILSNCTCRIWRSWSQCPHVVAGWAVLKRLVSPESLSQIRFSPELLETAAEKCGIEQPKTAEPKPLPAKLTKVRDKILRQLGIARTPEPKPLPQKPQNHRLVMSLDYEKKLQARIYRGKEIVSYWSSQSSPPTVQRFLATCHYFDGSIRFIEQFTQLTKGSVPIVFLDAKGKEKPLAWQPDLPLHCTVTLDISNDTISLIRTLDQGTTVPHEALYRHELLINPAAGTIQPLHDVASWSAAKLLEDKIYTNCTDDDDEDEYFDDDDEWSDHGDDHADSHSGITRLPHGISLKRDLFNKAACRLLPEAFSGLLFTCNGQKTSPDRDTQPNRLLNITYQGDTAVLMPLLSHGTLVYTFADSLFYFLRSSARAHFPAPLKAKKRIRHLSETFFQLIDEKKAAVRTKLIRTALDSADYSKRDVKRSAKQLLNHLLSQADLKPQLIYAQTDGWQLIEDSRIQQLELVRIIYNLLGNEPFEHAHIPAGAVLPSEQLARLLPTLLQRLGQHGFELRFDLQPLTTGNWQFSLDATHSSLDWFELKPEIRVNGELLTDQELQELLGGSGMLRKDGKLLLLDELSALVLAMFSGAMAGKKSKKGKQELVRVPRLQILDWLQLRKHGVEVKLAPQDAGILDSLLNFDQLPKPALPDGLVADLRHYQLDAWHWLAFLYQHRFGACLADDMGLGKTLQGITLMAGIISGALPSAAPPGSPHLVVAPPSLLFNWEAEITRFLPSAKVLLYAGTGRSTDQFNNHDIIITSYGIVQRDHAKLEKLRFDVLIFDETQVVKNLQAATTNAVRKLRGSFTLALTGTPVENHLGEYYAIMDLCLPGLLGSHDEFNRQINKEGTPAIQRLIQRTKPFVLRRTKQMIAAELPPKIETDIRLELSPKQKLLYQRTVEEVKGQVQEAYQNHAVAQARIIALTAILRLRQICLAPVLAAETASDASPKLEFLIEQLEELRDEGHSALVFSQFTGYLDIIEKGLNQQGLACLRLDGTTPVPQRKKLVNSFQESTTPLIFLISLKAGGKGLNLTRATYVYHMDPWWNPAVENQASDRAHRIGQTEQVTITRLIMRHTIEEKMMELKTRKLELYKALLEDGAASGGSGLTREDFEFLLG
jgi:non-specific serine/threonine protein kinase